MGESGVSGIGESGMSGCGEMGISGYGLSFSGPRDQIFSQKLAASRSAFTLYSVSSKASITVSY